MRSVNLSYDIAFLKERKVVIVQAFSKFYRRKNSAFLRENAVFLGRQLSKQCVPRFFGTKIYPEYLQFNPNYERAANDTSL